jgi:hypothetical protein
MCDFGFRDYQNIQHSTWPSPESRISTSRSWSTCIVYPRRLDVLPYSIGSSSSIILAATDDLPGNPDYFVFGVDISVLCFHTYFRNSHAPFLKRCFDEYHA